VASFGVILGKILEEIVEVLSLLVAIESGIVLIIFPGLIVRVNVEIKARWRSVKIHEHVEEDAIV